MFKIKIFINILYFIIHIKKITFFGI